MLGKTFKGMTDEMLAWQTERAAGARDRPRRARVHVRPELVVEVAFDGVQTSTRYPGGVALRFARVKGYRPDKRTGGRRHDRHGPRDPRAVGGLRRSSMPKRSAGLLVYRRVPGEPEVLLVHPGGPFWAKKDDGSWSLPKGEYEPDEDPLEVAIREFREELGVDPPDAPAPTLLGEVRQPGGKLVMAWALPGELNVGNGPEQHLHDGMAAAIGPDGRVPGGRPRRLVRPRNRPAQTPSRSAGAARPVLRAPERGLGGVSGASPQKVSKRPITLPSESLK